MDRSDAFINLILPRCAVQHAGPLAPGGLSGGDRRFGGSRIQYWVILDLRDGGGTAKLTARFRSRETETERGQGFILGISI